VHSIVGATTGIHIGIHAEALDIRVPGRTGGKERRSIQELFSLIMVLALMPAAASPELKTHEGNGVDVPADSLL
jgi:hypothetical protein